MSLIPIAFGTVIMGILAWEPATDPALRGSNQTVLKAVEPRTGGTAAQKDPASGPIAQPTIQESSIGRLQLVQPRPRLRLGSDEPALTPITEKPPGWVLLSIRF